VIQRGVKRSPRPPFVSTFTRAAASAAAALGTACSSGSGSPTGVTRNDTGTTNPLGSDDAGTDTSPAVDSAISGSDAPTDSPATDTTIADGNPAACPPTAPIVGGKCSAGTAVCTYADDCPLRPSGADTYQVECHLGKWELVAPTYEAACPRDIPDEFGPCLCGAHMPKACGYSICDLETEPQLLAICDEKSDSWLILVQECNPPPPTYDASPPPDAGSD
jgi:hypothetical protein